MHLIDRFKKLMVVTTQEPEETQAPIMRRAINGVIQERTAISAEQERVIATVFGPAAAATDDDIKAAWPDDNVVSEEVTDPRQKRTLDVMPRRGIMS